jgi:hypothetical protein
MGEEVKLKEILWHFSDVAEWEDGERRMTGPGLLHLDDVGKVTSVTPIPGSHFIPFPGAALELVEVPLDPTPLQKIVSIQTVEEPIQVHVATVEVSEQPIEAVMLDSQIQTPEQMLDVARQHLAG